MSSGIKHRVVKLNVGGTVFTSSTHVFLGHKAQESYFSSRLSKDWQMDETMIDGAYFIDRDPRPFELVLSFLRDYTIDYPQEGSIELQMLQDDADFYGLQFLRKALIDLKIQRELESIREKMPLEDRDKGCEDMIIECRELIHRIYDPQIFESMPESNSEYPSIESLGDSPSLSDVWKLLSKLRERYEKIQKIKKIKSEMDVFKSMITIVACGFDMLMDRFLSVETKVFRSTNLEVGLASIIARAPEKYLNDPNYNWRMLMAIHLLSCIVFALIKAYSTRKNNNKEEEPETPDSETEIIQLQSGMLKSMEFNWDRNSPDSTDSTDDSDTETDNN